MLSYLPLPEILSFVFLASKDNTWDDLPEDVRENIALISKVDDTLDILNDQGLFDEDGER